MERINLIYAGLIGFVVLLVLLFGGLIMYSFVNQDIDSNQDGFDNNSGSNVNPNSGGSTGSNNQNSGSGSVSNSNDNNQNSNYSPSYVDPSVVQNPAGEVEPSSEELVSSGSIVVSDRGNIENPAGEVEPPSNDSQEEESLGDIENPAGEVEPPSS